MLCHKLANETESKGDVYTKSSRFRIASYNPKETYHWKLHSPEFASLLKKGIVEICKETETLLL
jgi:hypothetical protein